MIFNISFYIRTLKKAALSTATSTEEFVSSLFNCIINTYDITDKNGEYLFVDKSRISKIMSNKENVHKVIHRAVSPYQKFEDLQYEFALFYEKYINPGKINTLINELKNVIEIDTSISNEEKKIILYIDDEIEFLTLALILSIKRENKLIAKTKIIWQRGNASLNLIEDDIFKYGFSNRKQNTNIIVIPVNSSFETHITRKYENNIKPLVSPCTIHGKWIDRISRSIPIEKITNRINKDLAIRYKQKAPYPIGTISIFENNNTIYYLLAISHFDNNNNAHSSKEHIRTALISLMNFYNQNGQGFDMFIPLLGTGLSRAALSNKESYDLICNTIISKQELITGKVSIVITATAFNELGE